MIDELDRAMVPFSAPEGWLSLDAWTGRHISEHDPLYTLELIAGDVDDKPARRAILWKFKPIAGSRGAMRPGELGDADIAEAAEQVRFKHYRSQAKDHGGVWIIEE